MSSYFLILVTYILVIFLYSGLILLDIELILALILGGLVFFVVFAVAELLTGGFELYKKLRYILNIKICLLKNWYEVVVKSKLLWLFFISIAGFARV